MLNLSRFILLLSSLLLLQTTLHAQNWQKLTTGTPTDNSAAASVGAGNGNTLFAGYGNNKGAFRSDNNGLSWQAVNSGLIDGSSGILTPKAFLRTSSGRIIRAGDSASWNNGIGSPVFYSDNNGGSWTQATFPFNTPSQNFAGTIVGFGNMVEHNGAIFASEVVSHGVWKSTDNGATWTASSSGIPYVPFNSFQMAYKVVSDGTALYAANPHRGIWRSVDNGATWQMDNAGIPGVDEALVGRTWIARDVIVTADGTVFGAVDNGVYRRGADGVWTLVSQGVVSSAPQKLAFSGNTVFVATGGPFIYESGDKGVTWRGISTTGLPAHGPDILNQSFTAHNGALYFAGNDGLYRTDLSSTTYINLGPTIVKAPKGGGVNEGKSFTFTVGVAGTGPFTYQWKKSTTVVGTDASYTITSATAADAGSYTVVITGPGGSVESTPAVSLAFAPNAPGAVDFSFLPAQLSVQLLGVIHAKAVTQATDGSVFIGGNFDLIQGIHRIRLAKTDYNGNVDSKFVTGSGLFSGTGPSEEVFTIVPLPNGDILVGGGEEGAGGDRFWSRYKPDGTVDYSYPWPIEINHSVYKAKLLPDGKVLVAGRLSNGIVRLNADGTTDHTWQLLTGFGEVRDFAIQSDGKIIVVGEFTTIGPRIVRLNSNGSLDGSFNPGTGASGRIYAVALDANDNIYIGGEFTQYNSVSRTRLARLDRNGVLDTTFNPGAGPSATVRDIAITSAGHVYIGGSFANYAGTPRAGLARVAANGTLDATYPDPQFAQSGGFAVYTIEAQPDGHLLVGGDFETAGGVVVNDVIRLLGVQQAVAIVGQPTEQRVDQGNNATFKVLATGTASLTYQWRKNGVNLENVGKFSGANSPTLTITGVVVADEDVYDVVVSNGGQSVTSTGAQLLVNHIPVIEIAPVGGPAPRGNAYTFTVKARGKGTLSYLWKKGLDTIPNSNSPTLTISPVTAADAGTYSVIVTGDVGSTPSGGATITVVERPGLLENIFVVPGNGPDNAPVLHVGYSPDGKIYASGYFGEWNDDPLRDSVVRLNANGSTDTGFVLEIAGYHRFAVLPDGKLIVADSSGVKRLNTNGTEDGSFTSISGPNDDVLDVVALPDGKIILAGEFTSLGGQSRGGIVRLNSNGTIDNTFYAGTGFINGAFAGAVHTVVVQPDGKLIVGGDFTKYQDTAVTRLVRLNLNGTLDTSFRPPTIDGPVYSVALQPDGKIIAGGGFQNVGGAPRKYLARFVADGNVDTSFVIDTQFNNRINDVLLLPSGKIVVGGAFTTFSGSLANGVMRLNADGSADTVFQANTGVGARLDTEVTDMILLPDGKIAIVGDFFDFDRQYRRYVAKLLNEVPDLAFVQTPSSTAPALGSTLVLHAKSIGSSAVSYQWRKGGIPLNDTGNISGSQTATLTITGVTAGNAGDYDVVITNLSGSKESQTFSINPVTAPIILVQPVSTNVVTTQTIKLGVTALGTGTLTYQWRKGTTPVTEGGRATGTQTSMLTIVNAETGDSGSYNVVVTDDLGNTVSASALVSVIVQPGSVNSSWTGPTFNSGLDQILILSDGRLLVSGIFNEVDPGDVVRRQIAILNANGTLNTTFAPTDGTPLNVLQFTPGLGARRLAVLPDGRFLMAATSSTVGGVFIYEPNGTYVNIIAIGGAVNDILTESDGSFVIVGVQSGTAFIRKYRHNGTNWAADTNFIAPIPNASVSRIIRLSNGQYLIGGSFTMVAGQSRPMVARLNANGTLDQSFAISGVSGPAVTAMVEEVNGDYLVLGGFSSLPGLPTSYGLARFSPNGSVDTAFNPNLGTTSTIQNYQGRDLKLQTDGKILVFGRGNVGIARLHPNGTTDASFIPGGGIGSGSAYIHAGAVAPNGDLYIVGDFANYNAGSPQKLYIAKVNNEPVHLAFISHPVSLTIDQNQNAQFSVSAYGSSTVSYQWLKNGQLLANGGRISGTAINTLNITGALPEDDAQYSLQISNLAGTTISRPATLTVLGAPVVQINLSSVTNIIGGSNVLFAPKIKAASTSTYTWYKDGNVVTNGGTITGATTATLAINGVQSSDAGTYQLVIQNSFGSASTVNMVVTVTLLPAGRDSSFRLPSGANHYVNSIALLPDGGALVGGQFTSIAGVNSNYFVRLDAYGTNVIFPTLAKFNNVVNKIFPLKSGKFLVTGNFTSVNDSTAYQRLVRLNADGSLDTSFQCPFNTTINAVADFEDGSMIIGGAFNASYNSIAYNYLARLNSSGIPDSTFAPRVSSTVNGLALQSDGKLVVGGQFSSAMSNNAYYYLARFNSDGTLDTAYKPEPNATVSGLQLLADDKLFVIGSFNAFGPGGSQVSRQNIARLNSNGSVDSLFVPPTPFPGVPTAFAVQPDGKVYLSGAFTSVGGQTRNQLARLNATGNLDLTFSPGAGFGSTSAYAFSIQIAPNGRVWVGGQFNVYDGTTVNYITRLFGEVPDLAIALHPVSQTVNRGTTVTFTSAGLGTSEVSYQWQKNEEDIDGETGPTLTLNSVQDSSAGTYRVVISNLSGSKISNPATLTVLGDIIITQQPQSVVKNLGQSVTFTVTATGALPINYQWRKNGINIPNATGASYTIGSVGNSDAAQYDVVIDNIYDPVISASAGLSVSTPTAAAGTPGTLDTSFTPATFSGNPVYGIDVDPQGRVFVGGAFTGYNSQTRNRLMRLNPDLTLDMGFSPNFNNFVYSTRFLPDGGFLVGGNFTQLNSASKIGIARFNSADAVQSTPTLTGNGTIGGNGPFGISVNPDGSYYIAGNFSAVNGTTRNYIAKLKNDSTTDTDFVPNPYPYTQNGAMRSIGLTPDGKILATGPIYSMMGGAERVGLVRYLANGTMDTVLTTHVDNGGNGPVGFGFQSNGKIIIFGYFSSVKDGPLATAQTRYGIARLNTDGTVDTAFNANLSVSAQVYDIVIEADDKIVIVGNFTTVNGTNRQRIARLEANGGLDTTFGSSSATGGADNLIYTIAQLPSGDYMIGGSFSRFNNDTTKAYLAKVYGTPPAAPALDIVQDPIDQTAQVGQTVTFSVAAVGKGTLSFQWRKGTTPLGVTTPQLVLTDVDESDAGDYNVIVTDATAGSVTSENATLTITEPLSFTSWMAGNGLTAGGNLGPDDDADGDGFKNVVEYVFNTLPGQSSSKPVIEKIVVNDGGTDYYAIRAVVLDNVEDVEVVVTASANVNFTPSITTVLTETDLGATKQVTIRSSIPKSSTPQVFFRIVIRDVVIEP